MDVLIEKLTDRTGDLYLIAEVLGEIGDPRAKKPLLDLLEVDDDILRFVVEDSLLALGVPENIIERRINNYSTKPSTNELPQQKQQTRTPNKVRTSFLGYAIPKPDEPSLKTFVLDMDSVHQKIAETQQVQELLQMHFGEEEVSAVLSLPSKPVHNMTPVDPFKSLDTPHFVFLNMLLQKPAWKMKDIEAIAVPLGLMANGALERLNDMALETCDEPLFEGDDPVEVNISLAKELLA